MLSCLGDFSFSFFFFLPPVMMSNHGNERVVYKREQLVEISRSQIILTLWLQIPHELKGRCCGCRSGAKQRERKRKLKSALRSFLMGNVRSLTNKLDEFEALMRRNLEFLQCSDVVHWHVAAGAYSQLLHLSVRISDNKGGQRYEEESKKRRQWSCSAFQQQMV